MKIKVAEATNNQIDWLVAKCEGFDALAYEIKRKAQNRPFWQAAPLWAIITNWEQAGPIIEREKIEISAWGLNEWRARSNWNEGYRTWVHVTMFETFGQNPLIAAMRCYVASKMGDIVEVPDNFI